MRASKWLAALALALGLAGQASAQQFFGFGILNTTNSNSSSAPTVVTSNAPIAVPQTGGGITNLRLRNFFPSFTRPSNEHRIGVSQFPTASQMPGLDYLKAFKYGRGVSMVP
jgi:hypothetical protein